MRTAAVTGIAAPRHAITRMRREVRRRQVSVTAIEAVTPRMRRIHFASPELTDFDSLSPDDHVKLIVPDPTTGELAMRDYTPRAFDPGAGTLAIDFALHGDGREGGSDVGPATRWALGARPGDRIEIGGPRGSVIIPDDFDWYLLIGDETALPAIGRRVEGLRADVPVTTLALIDGPAERQSFTTQAQWDGRWIDRAGDGRDDPARLLAALSAAGPLPAGDGFIWIAAEARIARALRTRVIEGLGHPKDWVKAAGYWSAGRADGQIKLED